MRLELSQTIAAIFAHNSLEAMINLLNHHFNWSIRICPGRVRRLSLDEKEVMFVYECLRVQMRAFVCVL